MELEIVLSWSQPLESTYTTVVASFSVLHYSCSTNNAEHIARDNFHQAFSALFVLQVTIAVVENWVRGYYSETPFPI